MQVRMIVILLLLAFLGIGCRGVPKKEIPPAAPAVQPVAEVLPEPAPVPVAEEPVVPTEPAIEPAAVEPEDAETVALRKRIATLRDERDKLRDRKEDVFTRLPAKTNRRLDRLERGLDDPPDDATIAPTEKEDER